MFDTECDEVAQHLVTNGVARQPARKIGTGLRKWDGATHHVLGEVRAHFPESGLTKAEFLLGVRFLPVHERFLSGESSRLPCDENMNGPPTLHGGEYPSNPSKTA